MAMSKTPKWLKEEIAVQFSSSRDNPYAHSWEGESFEAIVKSTDGGDSDCLIEKIGYGTQSWVGWSEVSPITPARQLNKTERKKLAAKVKADFDKLLESMREVQDNGLELDVYISTDDVGSGHMCEVSYQPPTPPKEVY